MIVPWGWGVGRCRPHSGCRRLQATSCPRKGYGKAPTRYSTSSIMTMWFLFPALLCLPCLATLWEYELCMVWPSVGLTSPLCVCKIPHASERGVRRPPRSGPPPSEHGTSEMIIGKFPVPCRVIGGDSDRFLFPPPCAFLASSPRAWEVCLFLCGVRELDPPTLPPRKGDHRVGAQTTRPPLTCESYGYD
eukprot:scaffold19083_cov104-Isochrysis_galbana.AAC.1